MWRLSWITFVFLPLTFLVGFFGMNVDTFMNDPSIKWYFVAAVPMMLSVLILWYVIKHILARNKTPYYRGIYEHLFHEMATTYPLVSISPNLSLHFRDRSILITNSSQLWSRSGPRETIKPEGTLARLKWGLVLYWNRASKTIRAGKSSRDVDYDDLGAWSRCKRTLTRIWTSQIRVTEAIEVDGLVGPLEGVADGEARNSTGDNTELFVLPRQEYSEIRPGGMAKATVSQTPWSKRLSSTSNPSGVGRPSSQGSSAGRNSGVMVEEERPNWLQGLTSKGLHISDWTGASAGPRKEIKGDNWRHSSDSSALKEADMPVISIGD